MSKLKNMPGAAWLVIGVCVTALALPSAAYAAGALKFTGIEGTNGTTASLNRVGVSSAGQVLTSEADATSLEFGDVPVNTPATQSVTLTSTGTAPVTINRATLIGASFALSGATFPARRSSTRWPW